MRNNTNEGATSVRFEKKNSLGWRKQNGPPLLIFCSNCGSISPSSSYNFGGTYFNLWDNEEVCPKCKFEHAKLSEGIFNLTREFVETLSSPAMTSDNLSDLFEIGDKAARNELTAEQVIERTSEINNRISSLFKRAKKHSYAAFMLLVAILSFFLTWKSVEIGKEQIEIGKKQIEIGDKQVEIANEQLKLQRDSKTDDILAAVLSELRLRGIISSPKSELDMGPTGSVTKKSGRKGRELKKTNEHIRRKAFGRSRSR